MPDVSFGLSSAHISHDSPIDAIDTCADLGLDAIELFTKPYTISECRAIRSHSESAGIDVDYHAAWDGDLDLGLADAGRGFAALELALARAHAMGARHLTCHFGRYEIEDPDGRERALDKIAGHALKLSPALEDTGVVLCFEDNTICHDADALGDEPRDFHTLFQATSSENVGMTLDTGHAHVTGNTRSYLQQFGRRVRFFHLDDNNGFSDGHLPPSAGTIDWDELVGTMARSGAEPSFSLEFNEQYIPVELPVLRDLVMAHTWRTHGDR